MAQLLSLALPRPRTLSDSSQQHHRFRRDHSTSSNPHGLIPKFRRLYTTPAECQGGHSTTPKFRRGGPRITFGGFGRTRTLNLQRWMLGRLVAHDGSKLAGTGSSPTPILAEARAKQAVARRAPDAPFFWIWPLETEGRPATSLEAKRRRHLVAGETARLGERHAGAARLDGGGKHRMPPIQSYPAVGSIGPAVGAATAAFDPRH